MRINMEIFCDGSSDGCKGCGILTCPMNPITERLDDDEV
jgi:hypothetical protein